MDSRTRTLQQVTAQPPWPISCCSVQIPHDPIVCQYRLFHSQLGGWSNDYRSAPNSVSRPWASCSTQNKLFSQASLLSFKCTDIPHIASATNKLKICPSAKKSLGHWQWSVRCIHGHAAIHSQLMFWLQTHTNIGLVVIVTVIVNSRFLQRPQKRSCGTRLFTGA